MWFFAWCVPCGMVCPTCWKALAQQEPQRRLEHQICCCFGSSENDERPGNQGFKKSAEIGHGSSAPLWLHQNTIKQVSGSFRAPEERSYRTQIASWTLDFQVFVVSWVVCATMLEDVCEQLPYLGCHRSIRILPFFLGFKGASAQKYRPTLGFLGDSAPEQRTEISRDFWEQTKRHQQFPGLFT